MSWDEIAPDIFAKIDQKAGELRPREIEIRKAWVIDELALLAGRAAS
jgi:hypothetical protein